MAKKYEPIDLSRLKTYSIEDRAHKFDLVSMAGLPDSGASFRQWWDSLPAYLGVNEIKTVVEAVVEARHAGRPVVFAMGAHVVKVGCSPIICDLIQRGIVTAVVMNGATAIHDVEVAMVGQTSEEVGDTINDGSFGMVQETPAVFADAIAHKSSPDVGLGAAVGEHLTRINAPNADQCILVAAHRSNIPVTVHVAMGTDTIHMHASVVESDLLALSTVDFRLVCSIVADLAPDSPESPAGVWCNIGSSVILPEVFLKAVAVARNLGSNLDEMTTANLDMIRHYRPSQNVVGRPVQRNRGHSVIGHHEILLPMLRQALIERY